MSKYIDISNVEMPKDLLKIPFYLEPTYYEMSYSLFEACNLHCKFCFEGHRDNNVDILKIKAAPFNIFKEVDLDLQKYKNVTKVDIRIWGGELFFDALSDEVFDAYKFLVDKCRELFKEKYPQITLNFLWLSNGVWTKWERIKELLDYSKGELGFSYDPIDRFPNEKTEQLMIDNVWRAYKEGYVIKLSITLTKKTVEAYINEKSRLMDFPPMQADINFYTANPGWEDLLLDDEDIYQFYKWALKKRLFNINVIYNLMAPATGKKEWHRGHYCECKTCKQYSNGYCTTDCAKRASILPHEMFYGKYDKYITEENVSDIKLSIGMKKRGCLSCPFYSLCQKPCWITIIFEGYKPSKECPYARIYKDIVKDKELIKDFEQFKNA